MLSICSSSHILIVKMKQEPQYSKAGMYRIQSNPINVMTKTQQRVFLRAYVGFLMIACTFLNSACMHGQTLYLG